SLGMYSPYLAKASDPAANFSHSIFTPDASRMRTAAFVISGPIPSPGINVTLYAMNSYWKALPLITLIYTDRGVVGSRDVWDSFANSPLFDQCKSVSSVL